MKIDELYREKGYLITEIEVLKNRLDIINLQLSKLYNEGVIEKAEKSDKPTTI